MILATFAILVTALPTVQPDFRGCRTVAFHDLKDFARISQSGSKAIYAKIVDPGFDWDQMVPSWNVDVRDGSGITIQARVIYPEGRTKLYSFGTWKTGSSRGSVKGQQDADADVLTDTLVLSRPGRKLEVQVEIDSPGSAHVRLLGLSFRESNWTGPPLEPNRKAWGSLIEVPRKSQMSYPNGGVLCSPAAVSMVLCHWASATRRQDLIKDVPEVASGVFDPVFNGHGNWPYNTAYAGSFPGMTAYVARLSDTREVEDWTAAGFPVICSARFNLLQGKEAKGDDGHLVVLVGFTATGDPIFNDPGWSSEVRQTYKRADFEKAWASSGRTVYLMYPSDRKPPPDRFGHWIGP